MVDRSCASDAQQHKMTHSALSRAGVQYIYVVRIMCGPGCGLQFRGLESGRGCVNKAFTDETLPSSQNILFLSLVLNKVWT